MQTNQLISFRDIKEWVLEMKEFPHTLLLFLSVWSFWFCWRLQTCFQIYRRLLKMSAGLQMQRLLLQVWREAAGRKEKHPDVALSHSGLITASSSWHPSSLLVSAFLFLPLPLLSLLSPFSLISLLPLFNLLLCSPSCCRKKCHKTLKLKLKHTDRCNHSSAVSQKVTFRKTFFSPVEPFAS